MESPRANTYIPMDSWHILRTMGARSASSSGVPSTQLGVFGLLQGLGTSDCKTELCARHILANSSIDRRAQPQIAVERFAVLDFRRSLANPRLQSDACMMSSLLLSEHPGSRQAFPVATDRVVSFALWRTPALAP
jgi:hypothetical protein